MKTVTSTVLMIMLIIGMILLAYTGIQAETRNRTGTNFVDLDGDGFNDNAPDHDGDGIPNGLDPDYIKSAQDGTGYQNGDGNASHFATLLTRSSCSGAGTSRAIPL